MKNKVLSIFLMCVLSISLVACGEASTEPSQTTEETQIEVVAENEKTEETTTPEAEPETTEDTKETETAETETTETEAQAEETKAEENAEESSIYTFTDLDEIKFAKTSVNVRNLPDTSGDKLGGLNTNDEVHITGQCNETSWYRIEYKGDVAYVSNSYLVSEKVEIAPSAETPSNSGKNQGTFNEADYTTPYQIINNGGLAVYYVIGQYIDDTYANQAASVASNNTGKNVTPLGGGTYYWFGDGYNGVTNAYGVRGLYFPYWNVDGTPSSNPASPY